MVPNRKKSTSRQYIEAKFQILKYDFLTIWGPTFTFIGPKVFGKIFVGELVLETGNATNETLPETILEH